MAGITLAQAQEQLEKYIAAESAILTGQSYEIAGRKLTRADLTAVQIGIKSWEQRVRDLAARAKGRGRSRTVIVRG
jgi:hypothetical protein